VENESSSKSEIMRVAKELFQQYGLNKTTIDEIAATAKKSKATIYQFFNNKEDIFVEILMEEFRSLNDFVISEVNKQKNSTDELKIYIITTISEAKKRLLLYSLLKGELKSCLMNHNKIKHEIDIFEKEVVKNIVYNGMQTGEFSKKYEPYLDHIAYYVINFTRGIILQLILDEESNTHLKDDDIFNVLIDIMIKGLKD